MKIPALYIYDRCSGYLDLVQQWKEEGIELDTIDSADEAIKIIEKKTLATIIIETIIPPGTITNPGLAEVWQRYKTTQTDNRKEPYIQVAKYLISVARQSPNAHARILVASRFEPEKSTILPHAQEFFKQAGADAYFYLDEIAGCNELTREITRIAQATQ